MFSKNVQTTPNKLYGCGSLSAEVGVEIELEGGGFENCPGWSTHNEGSVQGIEYVTKPVTIDKVKGLVDKLKAKLESDGALVKHTHRTSTHIHVNVSCQPLSTILGFLTVFVMFEPLLMRLCGNQRDGNLFCLSSYDTGDLSGFMSKFCKNIDKMHNYGLSFQRGKYSSLNILRMADLGTLECRCFPSSLDGEEVSKWCRWLKTMLDMAANDPDKTFRSLWKTVRHNPMHYAVKVFGMDAYQVPDAASYIDFGTENAYELTRVLRHWYSKPEKKEEEVPAKKFGKAKINLNPESLNDFAQMFSTPTPSVSPAPAGWTLGSTPAIIDDYEY